MSGFQKSVKLYPAVGVPGQEVNPGQALYTAENFISDGTLAAGGFAFAKASDGDVKTASATGTGKPLGFVERNGVSVITNPLTEATNV